MMRYTTWTHEMWIHRRTKLCPCFILSFSKLNFLQRFHDGLTKLCKWLKKTRDIWRHLLSPRGDWSPFFLNPPVKQTESSPSVVMHHIVYSKVLTWRFCPIRDFRDFTVDWSRGRVTYTSPFQLNQLQNFSFKASEVNYKVLIVQSAELR